MTPAKNHQEIIIHPSDEDWANNFTRKKTKNSLFSLKTERQSFSASNGQDSRDESVSISRQSTDQWRNNSVGVSDKTKSPKHAKHMIVKGLTSSSAGKKSRLESSSPFKAAAKKQTKDENMCTSKNKKKCKEQIGEYSKNWNLVMKKGVTTNKTGNYKATQVIPATDEKKVVTNRKENEQHGSFAKSSERKLNTKSQLGGILIVDPAQDDKKVTLDHDNHSLTNKDLLIVGDIKQKSENDDSSTTSSLTEGTYETREDKLRLRIELLQKAAVGSNQVCCMGTPSSNRATFQALQSRNVYKNDNSPNFLVSMMGHKNGDSSDNDLGNFEEKIIVCITRTYLATTEEETKSNKTTNGRNEDILSELKRCSLFDLCENNTKDTMNGLRCTWNEPKLSHELGVTFYEGNNGYAYVRSVEKGSSAEKSGVIVGDVVSFAVPLNSTFQGYENACALVEKLERIGMRSSYREIFDTFLSKTSSGWPVAIVYRRKSTAMSNIDSVAYSLVSTYNLHVDCNKSSDFLHELITQSREYDYEVEACGVFEAVRGNIEDYMKQPRSRIVLSDEDIFEKSLMKATTSLLTMDSTLFDRSHIPFVPEFHERHSRSHIVNPKMRRSPLLSLHVEDAVGIVYIRFSNCKIGSGLVLSRLTNGLWSAPCALQVKHADNSFEFGSSQFFFMIKNMEVLNKMEKKEFFHLTGKKKFDPNNPTCYTLDNATDVVCIEKKGGSFFCLSDFNFVCRTRIDANNLFYRTEQKNTYKQIKARKNRPKELLNLFGALRRLEFASTMYPHPSPPNHLKIFASRNWVLELSCLASENIDLPFDFNGQLLTLRELLKYLMANPSITMEYMKEFDVFIQKFKIFLFDGVAVDYIIPTCEENKMEKRNKDSETRTNMHSKTTSLRGMLKFDLLPSHRLKTARLHIIVRKSVETKNVTEVSVNDFETAKSHKIIRSLHFNNIIRISNSNGEEECAASSQRGDDGNENRLIVLSTRDGNECMLLARTPKDMRLLMCGLKLLAELNFLECEVDNAKHFK
mmetsp:Transcript_15817/g.22507  ORF Transcript_15817/g.22507 Transcript_15817/m.22507 type:complete len:1026 (+) Transcript_15817:102-3179(+)